MVQATSFSTVGEAQEIKLADLRLDPANPRLITSKDGESQVDLAVAIEQAHDSIIVAQSIADNGFFASEPLIVIPMPGEDAWTVVEGNRRLTALLGLAFPEYRDAFFESNRWEKISKSSAITAATKIPCVVVTDRRQVNSIIGFRHISGIAAWSSYAQAAFIARLIEQDGLSIKEISDMIGKSKSDVSQLFRNYAIARQAKSEGIATEGLEGTFSVLTLAMGKPALREHIGAPSSVDLANSEAPISEDKVDELRELVKWIFGDETTEAVVPETRQMKQLADVVTNEAGLTALRSGVSLEAAVSATKSAGMDPITKVTNTLTASSNSLRMAVNEIASLDPIPESVKELVSKVISIVRELEKFDR